ncbi:MAG: ZIP family metal transporter [Clostridium sp.]|nr:MAG: ZIP family metal transporter [Clostridium sp.]
MLHNFPEGMAVFMGAYTNISIGIKLCIAIMLHNIPEGIAIAVPLYYSGVGKRKTFLYTLFSGLTEPLGALLTYLLFKNYINDIFFFLLVFIICCWTNDKFIN